MKLNEFSQVSLRKTVFWPPLLILVLAVSVSLLIPEEFDSMMKAIQSWVLINFSMAFSWVSFFLVLVLIWVFVSPLGAYRIGGKGARPRLKWIPWFAIVLCTTIAVGILFWGSAEPLSHFLFPPSFRNISPATAEAKEFALGALFFHWGVTPYAIYAVPALLFTLLFHRKKQAFKLSIMLHPVFGTKISKSISEIIDMICLFAMVSGMAGALGAGILSLSGGLKALIPSLNGSFVTLLVTTLIVGTFVLSASSGIDKGIKSFSLFNLFFFLLFAGLFVLLSESFFLKNIGIGFRSYVSQFLDLSMQLTGKGNSWTYDWSVFNFAMWMAWAPMTGLFLAKIAIGRTVREFLLVNCLLPALFCLIWMGIFGGSTLDFASLQPDTYTDSFVNSGPESIIYLVFQDIGSSQLLTSLFLIGMFVSYVTAADSSTDAIASLSLRTKLNDSFQTPAPIKIIWGILIGILAWIMISFSGIDGVRILSVIGGLPVLIFLLVIGIGLLVVSFNPKKHLF